MFVLFCSDHLVKVNAVAWSPDGTRLVAVRNEGFVNQVANNNALSNVYRANVDVCITFAAFYSHSLSSCLDAHSVPVGSLPSAGQIKQ